MTSCCPECGDAKWAGRGYVAHKPMCSRANPRRPVLRESNVVYLTGPEQARLPEDYQQQDREAAALRRLDAPIPLYDSPFADDEDNRRAFLRRYGIGPRPKNEDSA